jgi:hypothetical protein
VLADTELSRAFGFDSKPSRKALLKNLEDLCDVLVHAQDIITGRWPEIIDLASRAEDLLRRCEEIPKENPLPCDTG